MSVRVTVLGSGTCVPRGRRGPAGYAVELDDLLLLIDSGSGTLGRLAQAGLDYRRLTHALYTHTHTDHTGDLGPLLFAMNYTPGFERTEPLELVGPKGFGEFLERLSLAWPWIRPNGEWLRLHELSEGLFEAPGLRVRSQPVDHAGLEANAYRFESAEGTVVFSGDTCLCPEIVEIAQEADLLIIESAVAEGTEGLEVHLSAAQAGQVAAEAEVGMVVLTHLYPAGDRVDLAAACRKQFDGEVLVAEDGMRIRLEGARPTVESRGGLA